MVPAPVKLHVTVWFATPPTDATNCCVCPAVMDAVVGVIVTTTADRFTVAVADLLASATEVAVTVTATGAPIDAGAVYNPLASIVPAPVTNHVTAVLAAFVTAAVNCWVCPLPNIAVTGLTVTVTGGVKVMIAVAVFVGSATDVAITVTAVTAAIVGGAV